MMTSMAELTGMLDAGQLHGSLQSRNGLLVGALGLLNAGVDEVVLRRVADLQMYRCVSERSVTKVWSVVLRTSKL